jgi:hypothetical protein
MAREENQKKNQSLDLTKYRRIGRAGWDCRNVVDSTTPAVHDRSRSTHVDPRKCDFALRGRKSRALTCLTLSQWSLTRVSLFSSHDLQSSFSAHKTLVSSLPRGLGMTRGSWNSPCRVDVTTGDMPFGHAMLFDHFLVSCVAAPAVDSVDSVDSVNVNVND